MNSKDGQSWATRNVRWGGNRPHPQSKYKARGRAVPLLCCLAQSTPLRGAGPFRRTRFMPADAEADHFTSFQKTWNKIRAPRVLTVDNTVTRGHDDE